MDRGGRVDQPLDTSGGPERPAVPARPKPRRRFRLKRFRQRTGLGNRILIGTALLGVAGGLGVILAEPANIWKLADRALARLGLVAAETTVAGYHNLPVEDIYDALKLDPAGSLLAYDTEAARHRIEELPWISSALVERVLPDKLHVTVAERKPYAVWQDHQLLFLVDEDGRALEPVAPGEHQDLPRIIGADAAVNAKDLFTELRKHPEVAKRFRSASRLASGRWTIDLTTGQRLLLPAEGIGIAIAKAEQLHKDARLFDRAVREIDLRIAGLTALRLTPEAAALRRAEFEKKTGAAKPQGGV